MDAIENIEGIEITEHEPLHVAPTQRVAYDTYPPAGGPHDQMWATCDGVVYERAVRNENMVHSLEHGAVWIAYDPDTVTGGDLDQLESRVDGQPYLMLSPYPGLDRPVSLQAWNHQLKVDRVDDPRIDEFIRALRDNEYTAPEPGAPCGTDPELFDPADPPAFDPSPPGPDAVPADAGSR